VILREPLAGLGSSPAAGERHDPLHPLVRDERCVQIGLVGDRQLEHDLPVAHRVEPAHQLLEQNRFGARLVGTLDENFRLEDRHEAVLRHLLGEIELLIDDCGNSTLRRQVDRRAFFGSVNAFFNSSREQIVEARNRLHHADAVFLGFEAFVDLQKRHDTALLPEIAGDGFPLSFSVHRTLEENRSDDFVACERRRAHNPHAKLVHKLEHLGIAAIRGFGNAVQAQGAGSRAPALVQRSDKARLGRHLRSHRLFGYRLHVISPRPLAASYRSIRSLKKGTSAGAKPLSWLQGEICRLQAPGRLHVPQRSNGWRGMVLTRASWTTGRVPACLAAQAALARFEGRVDTAIALYERALRQEMTPALELRIRENLASLFFSRAEYSGGERILDGVHCANRDDPRIQSLYVILRARRRDARVLEDIDALTSTASSLTDLEQARIYRRLGGAVYEVSGDSSACERYLNLVIERAEVAHSSLYAAIAYLVLAELYSSHIGDIHRVLRYIDLSIDAATKTADKGLLTYGLIERYDLAAETGDAARLHALQAQVHDIAGPERYAERPAVVIGEAMSYGWAGKFDIMLQFLVSLNIGRIISAQRSVYNAMIAMAYAGSGDEPEALKAAYRALTLARPLLKEPYRETRLRLIARFLSGCVLRGCNRRNEATRALKAYGMRMTPSLTCLRDAILDGRYDVVHERARDVYGYALLCDALDRTLRSRAGRSDIDLTEREIAILRAVSAGSSARAIADEFQIGRRTVEWHRSNAIRKLGVNSTLAAVAKARDLQIIS
jgi:DNA-binding CsgD family transcriptional regulator/tetratricopeptide (TPR) repeat protein